MFVFPSLVFLIINVTMIQYKFFFQYISITIFCPADTYFISIKLFIKLYINIVDIIFIRHWFNRYKVHAV